MLHSGRSGIGIPVLMGLALLAALAAAPAAAQAQDAAGEREITFTRDVAPLIHRSCSGCHRPDEVAPMSLITYEEVRPWARSIRNRVESREMPPWHIDRRIGIQEFKDDPSLTDEEIATIVGWVDAGAPRGNPADMPPLPQYASADDWQIGEPDLIVRYPNYLVPAAGPDLFGNLYADFGLEEDRYIRAMQTKPADKKARLVVHHTNAYATAPGDITEGVESERHLVEYASGKQAEIYPEDSGVLLQAGSQTRLSYHLHSVGEDIDTVIEMGIVLHPKGTVPKHVRWTKQLAGAHGTIAGPGRPAAGPGHAHGRLYAVQQGGAHHHVPAAHAHARQVPVPGADLPDAAGHLRGGQLRALRLQLAPGVQLRRRLGARWCRPAPSSTSSTGTTTPRRTAPTRIRATGPAAAGGPSTRWDSRGSAGTT